MASRRGVARTGAARYDRPDSIGWRPGAARCTCAKDAMTSHVEDLKSSGLKATLPRLKILEVFEKASQRHMTAEDVFRALLAEGSDIGLATVYRVLMQFEQAGILSRSHFESRQGGVRAQRGHAPRPPGVPRLRPGRGVLRRRDRKAPDARSRTTRGLRAAGPRAGAVRHLHEEGLRSPQQAMTVRAPRAALRLKSRRGSITFWWRSMNSR